MRPRVSVVIATRHRPVVLMAAVRDVLNQLPDAGDLWVVEQSDPDVQKGIVEDLGAFRDARLHVVTSEPRGLPAARNLGVSCCRGEIVLFFDDDVRLHAGCIAAHVAAFDDAAVGGVVGRIVEREVRPNARTTTNRLDLAGRVRTRLDGRQSGTIQTLKGANMSFRRVALMSVGPSDERYTGTAFLEDADWSTRVRRAGWTLRFEAAASVVHLSSPRGGCRAPDARRTSWWRFRNTGYFIRRHRTWATPLSCLVFGMIATRRAWERQCATEVPVLMGAWWSGWRDGADPVKLEPWRHRGIG